MREYQIAEDLKARALASTARVIVFPESVLPRWTPASDLFWADTIDALRSAGKVVMIGAITPTHTLRSDYDLTASLAALHHVPAVRHDFGRPSRQQAPLAYTNGVVVRGALSERVHTARPRANGDVATVHENRRTAASIQPRGHADGRSNRGRGHLLRTTHPMAHAHSLSGSPNHHYRRRESVLGRWYSNSRSAAQYCSRVGAAVSCACRLRF